MTDFTLQIYKKYLEAAIAAGYTLTSYLDYLNHEKRDTDRFLILRQDVDARPQNSAATARIQADLGATATYYFRIVPGSFQPPYIREIADMGHEIGYHYEDMALCGGDPQKAIKHFEEVLAKLREFYPVQTICMHGSPLSKYDNRSLWENHGYNYRDYDLIAEPYFDIDFKKEVFYFTDTGRSWDGGASSVRDKVHSDFDLSFHTTSEIIQAFEADKMPRVLMQNIHPQRWTDNRMLWWKELILQNAKNVVKSMIVKSRGGKTWAPSSN